MRISDMPDHAAVLEEVREVRRSGIMRLRGLDLPALTRAAAAGSAAESGPAAVERLLRLAVARLDSGSLRQAAEYSLGLAQGTRDWPSADRRRRAAEVYAVSVERFRKGQEIQVLSQVADQVLRAVAASAPADRLPVAAEPGALEPTHSTVRVNVGGRNARVTLHVHAADLLRDVDVVVSPSNVYLALPPPYKASVSAALRRAAAQRGPAGEVIEDLLARELHGWHTAHGTLGRALPPGSVAATGSGTMGRKGIRRIYHLATAVPRRGTSDYDVLPEDVTRGVVAVLDLLAQEHRRFTPPLRSVCFPLIGAGRGGLRKEQSIRSVWGAAEAELARGAPWDIHFVVRQSAAPLLREHLLDGFGGRSLSR